MRILVLCYEFPPIGGGGGKVAEDVARTLASRGHEILVHSSLCKGLARREQRMGFVLYRSFCLRRRPDQCSVPEMLAYLVFSFFPALWLAIRFRPQLIHAHFAVPSGVLAFALAMILRIPYVLTAHLGDVPGGVPSQTDHLFRWLNVFIRPIWKQAAAVTAVSGFVAQLADKAYGIPIQVIENGIDIPNEPMPEKPNNPTPQLLFVGRFNEQKQPLMLFDILDRIRSEDWDMHLAGNGPLFDACREKARQLGLDTRCTFHGWITNTEVDALMSACDVLIMPSTTEGFPVTCVKALRFGLALVTSEHASFRGIVFPGENGYLCSTDKPADYANALEKLLGKTGRLSAMQAGSLAMAPRYDLQAIASRYEEIFLHATKA